MKQVLVDGSKSKVLPKFPSTRAKLFFILIDNFFFSRRLAFVRPEAAAAAGGHLVSYLKYGSLVLSN